MTLLSRFSIRAKITFLICVLVFITGGLYTVLLVNMRKQEFIAEVDAKLLAAAKCTQNTVGREFHDRIRDTNSLSRAEYNRIVALNNETCRDLGLSYIWSVLVLDTNTIVFTSATSPSQDVTQEDHAPFFAVHSDPVSYADALSAMEITRSKFQNEWGAGRMILIPDRDSHGRIYIVGASVQLSDFRAAVRQTVQDSIAIGTGILLAALLIGFLLARYLAAPIVALTEVSERMARGDDTGTVPVGGSRELVTLAKSFNTMRDSIRSQMAALKASEQNVTITLNSIGDAVIATDERGIITRMNRVAEDLTGWPHADAVGQPLSSVFRIINADTRKTVSDPVELVLAKGEVVGLANHTLLVARDGTERQIADSGAPIRDAENRVVGVVLVFRDVTEEYALHSQLEHARRMQAIGRLAGGVAHDFNNLLMAIHGNAELLSELLSENGEAMESVDEIRRAAQRGTDLTQQLLGFARKGKLQTVAMDIHGVIQEVTNLLRRSVDPRVDLRQELNAPRAVIMGDPSQWHHALLNLAVNACDAMDEGGTLVFRTSCVYMTDAELLDYAPKRAPGNYFQVAIIDTGVGMDAETKRHIFEPFFTTKPQGKGTGLGLAGVFGTVESHGGAINVTSATSEGTSVSIILLPTEDDTGESPTPLTPPAPAKVGRQGGILVVDDEPSVRRVVSRALEGLGYNVTTCPDGEEALRWYEEHGDSVDLVLLDERMPKLSGTQTFIRMKELNPEIKVIVMSGFTDEGVINGLLSRGVLDFVAKPFQIDELSDKIAQGMRSG